MTLMLDFTHEEELHFLDLTIIEILKGKFMKNLPHQTNCQRQICVQYSHQLQEVCGQDFFEKSSRIQLNIGLVRQRTEKYKTKSC